MRWMPDQEEMKKVEAAKQELQLVLCYFVCDLTTLFRHFGNLKSLEKNVEEEEEKDESAQRATDQSVRRHSRCPSDDQQSKKKLPRFS